MLYFRPSFVAYGDGMKTDVLLVPSSIILCLVRVRSSSVLYRYVVPVMFPSPSELCIGTCSSCEWVPMPLSTIEIVMVMKKS